MKKDLAYYKANAEEDYKEGACLSVLRYISELESELEAVKAELDETELDNDWQKARVELLEKHYKAENERLKAELEKAEKGFKSLSDQRYKLGEALKQAEAERDELKAFVKDFWESDLSELREWERLDKQAQELLKEDK